MTCAIMMELIQGEGGVLPLDREFVKEVEKLCREKDMLLIIDEVQTGIGRNRQPVCLPAVSTSSRTLSLWQRVLAAACRSAHVMAADTCCNVLSRARTRTTFGGTPIV